MTMDYQHCLGPNGRCYYCGEFDPRSIVCQSPQLRYWRDACEAKERRATFQSVDSPSPVRASAQETAKQLWQTYEHCGCTFMVGGGYQPCRHEHERVAIIEAALLAAEARGRQQAEQERDERHALMVAHARSQGGADGFQAGWHAALTRIADTPIDELRALVPEPLEDPRVQRAEQARDGFSDHTLHVWAHGKFTDNAGAELARQLLASRAREAALTQALKDWRAKHTACVGDNSCTLCKRADAALTGAPK